MLGDIMKTYLLRGMIFGLAVMSSSALSAQNCSSPPRGFGSSWWRAYAAWCTSCCGTPNAAKMSCNPGPNWGCRNTSGSSGSSSGGYDYEAERQRQEAERKHQEEELRQQEEERQRREAEERQRQQEEFQRNKDRALQDMKRIGGDLGLKGVDSGSDLGLKRTADTGAGSGLKSVGDGGIHDGSGNKPPTPPTLLPCKWGDQPSSVVDLRCLGLDPDKPIILDPWVVRGRQRVFPAQPDPTSLNSPLWHKGWMALARPPFGVKEAEESVASFKALRLQKPNDPLVRMGQYVAEGILKSRQERELEEAQNQLYHGIASLMVGDLRTAQSSIESAAAFRPTDQYFTQWEGIVWGMAANYPDGNSPAMKLAAHAFVFEAIGEPRSAIRTLEMAARMYPKDAYLMGSLVLARTHYFEAVELPRFVAKPATGSGVKPINPNAPHN